MFNKVSSKRSPLPPQMELELANIYLEQGRIVSKEGKHEIALVLCEEAEASLFQMKKGVKAAEAVQDVTDLRHGVARAFVELSKLLDELKKQEKAKESYKKAQEWGYSEVENSAVTEDHQNNPAVTQDHQNNPVVTQDHQNNPAVTQDHSVYRSSAATRDFRFRRNSASALQIGHH
ncbi:hypothetical protein F5H01DRAFT_327577 [Linnemannia elongata]|nr:hypothetical protein F5H01DRAFT_327577 [Linnemannia elongata]